MASTDAITAYCFAFLILIVYTVDAIVQWRHAQDSSRKYLLIQLSIIMAFFVNELVLLVVSQQNLEESREAMLHSLQGLSLLQGLVIEAMCVSRLHLGNKSFDLSLSRTRNLPWLHFSAYFPWILCFIYAIAFTLLGAAFVGILQSEDAKGQVFVVTAVSISHCFLACSSLRCFQNANLKSTPPGIYIASFNLVSVQASVLVLLFSSITTFLLGQAAICLISNGLWVFLMVYNYEIRKAVAEPERTDIAAGAGRRDRWSDLESDGSTNIIDNI
ncbi:uncharacterized protein RAG0_14792 [Rhynchosporium agropyri]|uniref:Uncharacterized protein n=1 Tax=Rhynchosporium agropyri TaxID=914238 RepID=A0A1E1LIE3_9HELO|nr:uncharacterized protein RAG0_14792 [Rhynchosporium agropyri]